jgi:hypothetical protein
MTAEHDLIENLEQCFEDLDEAQQRVEEFGEEDLQELADAYEDFVAVLERYEEDVTGDAADVETNIEFQSQLDKAISSISDDMLLSETFEECDDYLQQKWFNTADFEHVYEQLDPVADLAQRLYDRDDAREAYRDARHDVQHRLRQLNERISELEDIASLSDADLDAPTERLRNPIETYNEAVTEAFQEFRRDAPAREVIEYVESMAQFPLVPFESPPSDTAEYLLDAEAGSEPLPTVLEYAGYSRSKLDHYVDDPGALKRAVDRHRAYLDRLDADPLRVEWPPAPADGLRFRCRELTSAVNRLDHSPIEELRAVAALPREPDYERLRNSALVEQELNDEQREQLAAGEIQAELSEKRTERDRLETALEDFPDL